MKEINFKINLEEANLILEALGNQPFAKVYALIGKLQEQADQQLSVEAPQDDADKVEYPAPTIDKGDNEL